MAPLMLIFDFDGTITTKDTISQLAELAISRQRRRRNIDLTQTWQRVVSEYSDDRSRYISSWQDRRADAKDPLRTELDFLAGMKTVEEKSLSRVRESEVFRGLSAQDLQQMGREAQQDGSVQIRDGFANLMQRAAREGWKTAVISVNWSKHFIKGVLADYKFSAIEANEVGALGEVLGPQSLSDSGVPLTTSTDKQIIMERLLSDSRSNDTQQHRGVYFGDSETDLACLLQGGIVICGDQGAEGSNLMKTLERVDIQVPNVSDGKSWQAASRRLLWATGFRQVLQSNILNDTWWERHGTTDWRP